MDYDQITKELKHLDTVVAVKRAAREPHANKLTQIYRRGSEGYECRGWFPNKRGQGTAFYVAHRVNVAGYILTWKCTYHKNGKRVVTDVVGFKSRAAAVACAERRAARFKARMAKGKGK